jgi:spore maturation protein CgeB
MDILIVTNEHIEEGERHLDDKGWSFDKAFRRLGHKTEFFFYRKKGSLRFLEKRRFRKYWTALMNRRLIEAVKRGRPDLVLLLKADTVEAETIHAIKKSGSATVVNVFPDNPLLMGNFGAIAPCDLYFVKDTYVADALRSAGLGNVRYLPQATDPDVHHPVELSDAELLEFGADVSLLGSMYPYRLQFMKAVSSLEPVIWGRGWDKCGEAALLKNVRGRDVRGSAKTKAICGSAINLNPHHPLNDVHGVNRRTYDIAACGGFQLTEHKRDLDDILSPGEEIVCYRSVDELKELATYYLDQAEERRAISSRARERVLREHTYDIRARQILEMLGAA